MGETTKLLDCIEVGPSTPRSTVIWLHGLGASGDDFVPIVPGLGLPDTRFVFPHAPTRPVTINMGHVMRAWYDITSLSPSATREPIADIQDAARQVEALIERETSRGIPAHKIVLAGFSQGGAVALHVGLRHAEPLAGVLVLSAYALVPDSIPTQFNAAQRNTPLHFAHGSRDPMVPISRGRAAHKIASELMELPPTWSDYPMEHQVCPEQLIDIRRWLHAALLDEAPSTTA